MKTFLCVEDGEKFTMDAENLREAKEFADMWNAEVIKEVKHESGKKNNIQRR